MRVNASGARGSDNTRARGDPAALSDTTVEYRIAFSGAQPDLSLIDASFRSADPSSIVDFDPRTNRLRVAATFSAPELSTMLQRIGYGPDRAEITLMPSGCCGGCGG